MWKILTDVVKAYFYPMIKLAKLVTPETWDEGFMTWAAILVTLFIICLAAIAILS